MSDVASWYEGAEVIGNAERALRVGSGPLPTRVAEAGAQLANARESQFPDWLWPEIRELRAAATAVQDDDGARKFADALAIVRDRLDQEISGPSEDFLSCPRCKLRLIEGTVRIDGGFVARLIGTAVLSVRFTPDGSAHKERRIQPLDALKGLVCPVCEAVTLDIDLSH
jgi:hypothetical protein